MVNLLPSRSATTSAGISMIEVLVTIGALGIVATLTTLAVSGVNKKAQHNKLTSDVQTLNSALKLYVNGGGDLSGITDPDAVLAKLKTSLNKEDRARHVGAPSGRMIDNRVVAVDVPAESWKLRAEYDDVGFRFAVKEAGDGVEFALDPNLNELSATVESRTGSAVSYAKDGTWVWDHASTRNPDAPAGPSTFKTNPD